nr:5'-nucleotidase-like [Onthophagus taurus]
MILNISNVEIGLIGYTGKDTATKYPVGDLEFKDELESVKSECKKLTEKNVKIIIALGNANLETDLSIAKEADCVDVLIGGDSSLFLWNDNPNKLLEDNPSSTYPLIIQNDKGKIIPILEGFSKTRYIGKIDLKFDIDGDLIDYKGNPMLLDAIIPRSGVADKILLNFTASYEGKGNDNDILGEVPVYLSASKCRERECNIGNMIADALIHYKATKYKGKYWTDTPIAIFNAGSIRKSINTTKRDHKITQKDLLEALPFHEPLITVVLDGRDLKHTLEVGARYNGETKRGEFLMVSGLKVIYDFHRPPYSRVLSVSCRCGNCKTPSYSPIVYNEYYRIVTTVFLANGGDGHTVIRSASLSFVLEGVTDLVATKNYLLSQGKIRPECDDRIVHMRFMPTTSGKLNVYNHQDCIISFFIISLIYLISQ